MKVYHSQEKLEQQLRKYKIEKYFSDFDFFNKYMQLVSFSKNDMVYEDKCTLDYIYFFLFGKLKVSSNRPNGKSLLLCFYEDMEILGDLELFELVYVSNTIKVVKESYCISIPVNNEIVREALLKDIKFLNFIAKSLAVKLYRISGVSSTNILCPLENRLAYYILFHAEKNISRCSGHNKVFHESLNETAELLGASYRHLHRTLQQFVSKGILEKREDYYVIKKKYELEVLSSDAFM